MIKYTQTICRQQRVTAFVLFITWLNLFSDFLCSLFWVQIIRSNVYHINLWMTFVSQIWSPYTFNICHFENALCQKFCCLKQESIYFAFMIRHLLRHTLSQIFRSSHRRCSITKGVLRNFAKFTGKHLCQRP